MKSKAELPFSIAYVSSQTEQNPATKLINAGPYSEGWISIPNTRFPQELVLDFGNTVALTELTFVSHQCKIASSIILLAGKDASNFKKAKYSQLDSFQFSDNRQRNYKARESLCCHLPSHRLRYLKLIIENVYQNNLNKGNQVGIVSIVAQGFQDDIDADDPELANLQRQKKEALKAENYQLCVQIKAKIDNIINNRAQLNELNLQKEEAVRNENYIRASQIKLQIDRILAGGNLDSPPPAPIHQRRQRQSLQEPPPYENEMPRGRRTSALPPEPQYNQYNDMNEPPMDDFQYNTNNAFPPNNFQNNPYPPDQGNFPANNPNYQDNYDQTPFGTNDMNNNRQLIVDNYDNRPIRGAKGGEYDFTEDAYPNDDLYAAPPQNFRQDRRSLADDRPIRQANQEDLIDVKDDFENERIEPPEELTEANRKEAEIFIEYGYENTIKYFYSKNVQNRIRGIKDIADIIKTANSSIQTQFYMRYCHMLRLPLKQKVLQPIIFSRVVNELSDLTDSIRLSSDNIRQAIEVHIPTIVRNLGNKKEQIANASADFIRWAAKKKQALGVQLVIQYIIAPTKLQMPWENQEVRLKLVDEICSKSNDPSINYGEIINYCIEALFSKMSEVRKASCKVLKTLSMKGQGQAINKLIQSSTLSSATKKMVKNEIQSS
ncbi:hypothetical protein TRFO_06801 [Tritrichomonas foetus]|uniref:Centrosomal protein CEP104 N-terminal domain-containing protein n=1 Tax=Tritrichomonas foetus TaxID=1144522 RepID=A0A1J4K034_9EUKA|nr:hypothetical protein TRFO_06801 [Tritrichomonas foetus]|eukprot:OHT03140.1 hypothetical protein TRFO_06801 [Tritrichomonas foetus]